MSAAPQSSAGTEARPRRGLDPQLAVALGFLAAILIGAFLLMLPFTSPTGAWRSPLPALFTACSAVCVTGLSVIDIGRDLTFGGQLVLLGLVQLGCLGLMTCGTFLLIVVGRRLSMSNEFSLMNAYGVEEVQGLRGLVFWIVGSMLFFESLGAVVLWTRFAAGAPTFSAAFGDLHAWYLAVFYSVMAFCNAGFGLDPASLVPFRTDSVIILTMGVLCIAGGIGFLVIYNLCTFKFWRRNIRARGRVTLHTRVVLAVTALLIVLGFGLFLLLENAGTLAGLAWPDKLVISFFQSVTPRTCGFTAVPIEDLHPATRLVTEVLMFLGASPGSAGGGIKTTTIVVLFCTLLAMCRGREETTLFHRSVPNAIVRESFVIFIFAMTVVNLALGVLLVTEAGRAGLTPEALLFEVVSAASTTGLSDGNTTALLSPVGQTVIMLCMFLGRLGALSVVLMIGEREEKLRVRYPNEELVVG